MSADVSGRPSVLGPASNPPDEDVGGKAPREGDCDQGDPPRSRFQPLVAGQVDQHPKAEPQRQKTHEREREPQGFKS